MHNIHYYAAAVTSYIVAVYSMFFSTVSEHGGTIVSFLGFVLLLARLVQEVPKAYRAIFPKKETPDE